jgi:hypothetical protein
MKRIIKIVIGASAVILVVVLALIVFWPKSPQPSPTPPPIATDIDSLGLELPLQQSTLFFYDANALELTRHEVQLRLSQDTDKRLEEIVKALTETSPDDLINPIPKGTSLYAAYLDDHSTAYLDFSRDLADAHIVGTMAEFLTVSAILQTVQANFPDQISRVQILIEGQEVDTLAGHIDISKPLSLLMLEE